MYMKRKQTNKYIRENGVYTWENDQTGGKDVDLCFQRFIV